MWVQPADYPLPLDFTAAATKSPETKMKASEDGNQLPAEEPPASKVSTPPVTGDAEFRDDAVRLEKLKDLRARGVITQEEYDRKKKEILDAM